MPGATQIGVAGQGARMSSHGHSSHPARRSLRSGPWYRHVLLRERSFLLAGALVAVVLLLVQRSAPRPTAPVHGDWSGAARSATRAAAAVQAQNELPARPELVKELAEPAPHRAVVTAAGRGNTRAAEQMTLAARALADRNPRLALQRAEEAIRIDPRYAPAWRGRGMLLDSLGRTREAADAYREYLRLEPAGDESSSIRKRLWQLSPR
jgi:tetratricopeptide (TPR) repeat protein